MRSAKSILRMDPTELRRLVARMQLATAKTKGDRQRAKATKFAVYEGATFQGRWTRINTLWYVLCSRQAKPGDVVEVARRDGEVTAAVVEETVKTIGNKQIAKVFT